MASKGSKSSLLVIRKPTEKKKVPRKVHNPHVLKDAIAAVRSGMSSSAAAAEYGIPASTIRKHKSGIQSSNPGPGRPQEFSIEEERKIVIAARELADVGLPIKRKRLKDLVEAYVQFLGRRFRFKNGRPGDRWIRNFQKRWRADLKVRRPEALQLARAKCLTQDCIDSWFQLVDRVLRENNLFDKPAQYFNADETGFSDDSRKDAVFVPRESRNPYQLQPGSGKDYTTVLNCISASGVVLPPYIVYRAKHLYENWCVGGPDGTRYNNSARGWMEEPLFYEWMQNLFLPQVRNTPRPVILFLDGHSSHTSIRLQELARNNQIIILFFPPHTTHALQPLDVSVYGPAKAAWRNILNDFYLDSRFKSINKEVFSKLQAKLFQKAFTPQHCAAGFSKTGLFPLDKTAIPKDKIKVSTLLSAETTTPSSAPSDAPGTSGLPSQTPTKAIRSAIREVFQPSDSVPFGASKRRRISRPAGESIGTHGTARVTQSTNADTAKPKKSKEARGKKVRRRLLSLSSSSSSSDTGEDMTEPGGDDWESYPCLSCRIRYCDSDCDWRKCVAGCERWIYVDCIPLTYDTSQDFICDDCGKQSQSSA